MESGLNYADIQQTLTNDLTCLDLYLQRWRLRRNVNKTVSSCFHLTNCLRRENVCGCGEKMIPTTANPKYFGVTFDRLYRGPISPNTAAKLRCLLHYFKTVTEKMPQGNLTYSRQVLKKDKLPNWVNCHKRFPQLHVSSGGTIEDDGYDMLQVDFANKYIGGGVLGEGCVQEEIRFVICPELIVSLLFTEVLDRNEAVVITGPQRFSNYKGYARSFQWDGDYEDPTPRDNWGRRCTQVVAIDAISVKYDLDQFEAPQVCRELNKAYVGFYDPYDQPTRTAVATGNWGCGAFGGDVRLKALIQLMAAAEAGRDVCYFTYKDNTLTQDIYNIHKLITDRNLTVGCVWGLICDYSTYLSAGDSRYRSAQSTTRNYGASNSRSVSAYGTKERVHGARDRKKDVFKFIQEKVSSCRITSSSSNSSRYGDGKKEDRPNNSPGDEDDGKLWDQT
ncbi:Poly(ADP-ribose) glycohydrolase [Lamellibrachia satsuma]|nr:Poly(ADP-ribose) glycohydrolase [Lamellibrachia satsuma]